mmetsp:Transcript_110035/g.164670  ORF Transcript_110035/g.164670 Transcript_110035/m.164670 type:complete len:207 (+) Transcript_110035:218-838(+)
MNARLLALAIITISVGSASAKCFSSSVSRDQGLCQGTFNVKVCAGNQTAADRYVQENHGVIVRGNCKKALTIVCGDVGGGEPTDDLEGICCRVADQCETDADCGTWEDPVAVPMCCSYCEEMYGKACRSSRPVHSAFASVVALYDAFYISEVKRKCAGTGHHGSSPPCQPERAAGLPCLQATGGLSRRSSLSPSSSSSSANAREHL